MRRFNRFDQLSLACRTDKSYSNYQQENETAEGMEIDNNKLRTCSGKRNFSFESLFKLSSPEMNLFRLRYNLEVLSAQLIPVNCLESQVGGGVGVANDTGESDDVLIS